MKFIKNSKSLIAVVFLLCAAGIWYGGFSGLFSKKIRYIVLISIDTCRADYLSCYGYSSVTTPNIDAVADEGIVFENAVVSVPLTLPSHSTMLTGTIPPYHGVRGNTSYRLGDFNLTIAEILQKKGYKTGGVIGSFILGSQLGISQGFDDYYDRFMGKREQGFEHERRAEEVSDLAVKWLGENADEDFFLFLHYFDPHVEYIPPEPFASKFTENPYAGEIAYTDECIGKVIDKLKSLGIYESTLLIITADHGESFGEHDEYTHSYFIYNPTVKVPLVFKLPGQNNAKRVKDMVGIIDIVPTILGQAGISIPVDVQGKDLSAYLGGETKGPQGRYFYCESLIPAMVKCSSLYGVICDDWKYIQTNRDELYNLKDDPAENNNLIEKEVKQSVFLKDQLKKILVEQSRPEQGGSRVQTDQQSVERLRGLGYLGGNVSESEMAQGGDDPKDHVKLFNKIVELLALNDKGQKEEVKKLCEEVLRQRPGLSEIHNVWGDILREESDLEGAMEQYRLGLESNPPDDIDNYVFHSGIADILATEGKDDEAVYHYSQALRINPDHDKSHCHLARIALKRGNIDEAFEHLSKAVEINPNYSEAHYHLGSILAVQGKLEEAIKHFSQTVKLTPDRGISHYHFANCLASVGRTKDAISEYRLAIELSPDRPEPANRLASILATDKKYRDPAEAVTLAELACKKSNYNNPEFLNTLAAAYASAGRNTKAIVTAEKALELARSQGREDLIADIQGRLEAYKRLR